MSPPVPFGRLALTSTSLRAAWTGRPMGTRVLGAGNWYRPGWVSAACDRPPCGPHVAGAHVSGPGWRLTGLYETIFGCICTCSSRRFQRYHPRVRQPLTGDYRCSSTRTDDAPKMSSRERGRPVARRSNELGVERVQPAAFAPADCSPCPGLPAFAPAQVRVHFRSTSCENGARERHRNWG